jgi:3-dehydroquinate synthase
MQQHVHVNLGDRSYDIKIGGELLDQLGTFCVDAGLSGTALVISDSHVEPLYGARTLDTLRSAGFSAEMAVVPAGEPSKCSERLVELWAKAIESGLDRNSFIVALGGGVVGDLSGFVAGSFLRGVRFVQVPTSLLAMVDSAVGGKTGINMPQGKNLIGAFHQPALVLADLDVLATLPPREFAAGMAEIIKYGVIYDAELFSFLEQNVDAIKSLDRPALAHLVKRSCEIKALVVEQDEREGGLRAILNYGHTLGHAVEKVTQYKQYLHGEGIAIGMVYASIVSEAVCGLDPAVTQRQIDLFKAFDLPTVDAHLAWDSLRSAMSVDKKAANAVPRFVLASEMGKVGLPVEVSDEQLVAAWSKATA